jgi:NADH-quinone oxidoreductase subunit A
VKEYLPILLQVIIAIGFAASALIISVILGKAGKRNATKDSAYECGMPAEGAAQPRFSVKFYLVAMLFILFAAPRAEDEHVRTLAGRGSTR